MPEIKNQFTGGKMNKDVDERLVPKGEYRDAMNIQVSTSEGSDVGTVQNILGNSAVVAYLGIDSGSMCVGAVADEKNDALYWFMREPSSAYNLTVSQSRDIIFELKSGNVQHVFVDMKSISIAVDTLQAPASGDIVINSQTGFNAINIGDTFQLFANGVNLSGTEFYTVLSKNQGALSINIGDYTNASWANYQAGAAGELQITLNTGGGVLKFPSKIITGINIIDDMLFWTDGVTEPKKINIPRSIAGTASGNFHTRLINLDQNITYGSNILTQEKHITVIRKAPLKVPFLEISLSSRDGVINGITNSQHGAMFSGASAGDQVTTSIDDTTDGATNFKIGDTLRLGVNNDNFPDEWDIRVSIIAITSQVGYMEYVVEVESMKENIDLTTVNWYVELEDVDSFFARKLPRFAYRYKYKDNEYSSFSPFTQVAFVPGEFSYEPIEAYNKGMVNTIKSLVIKDFIPTNIPLDVVQVDILYKNEINPTVYLLKSIRPTDVVLPGETSNSWNSMGSTSFGGSDKGAYKVSSENISYALPSSQSLRSFDNVPKKALAQDISGNRIIYGNYEQGYDSLLPQLTTFISNRTIDTSENIANKSIKSLRDYDIGIVWGDKYGRETPVKTSGNSITIPKSKAITSNYITASLENSPDWADYYRFYIKETANEYYNLAVDRVYDAADGNIWISFPSVDRNKVDEDTYIILKKGTNSDELVSEEARFKIVAIENEAPEYIKTIYERLVRTNTDASRPTASCNMYGGSNDPATHLCNILTLGGKNAPTPGMKGFSINSNRWSGEYSIVSTTLGMGLTSPKTLLDEVSFNTSGSTTDELYVSFSQETTANGNTTSRYSSRYHVVNVNDLSVDDGIYYINLATPILSDDEFITQNTLLADDNIHIHFWKKTVINKPEYDGRFFVKILGEKHIKDQLMVPREVEGNLATIAATALYKIKDDAFTLEGEAYNFHTNTDTESAPADVTTNSKGEWEDILKFGGTSKTAQWFIDGAGFASKQNGTPSLSGNLSYGSNLQTTFTDSVLTSTGGSRTSCDLTSTITGQEVVCNCFVATYTFNIMDAAYPAALNGNPGAGDGDHGDGKSNGKVAMKGVHENASDKFIDIAYSRLGPTGETGETTDYSLDWRVGNSNNASSAEEVNVVAGLNPGGFFKLAGSEVVYKILGAQKFRLFNYHGAKRSYNAYATTNSLFDPNDTCGWCWNQVHTDQTTRMASQHNRRLTYRIRYEVEPLYTPDSTSVTAIDSAGEPYHNITGTSPVSIEFLTEFTQDGENPISKNPAIFETEPKEDVDIDIYYEASSSVPTLPLTNENKYSFIPVGSTIIPPANTDFPEGIFITSWESVDPNSPQYIINLSAPLLSGDFLTLLSAQITHIEKDNGEIISFQVIAAGALDPATGLAIALLIIPKKEIGLNWFNCWSFANGVESNRIGDTYNKPYLTNGVTASSSTEELQEQEARKNSLIYSGLYNSKSGVNNLNQFIAAEKITKDINPIYGSIQKLHAGWGQGGDLVALCEDRILKILANKDALFNADGNTNVTSTNNVLGTAIPYSGEYGISRNPESFASEAYRIYFTDKVRGTVMRLSMDGLTPISNHGMKDWFRDNLKLNSTILGSYDDKKDEYNVTLQQTDDAKRNNNPVTVTFREDVKGWVSFKSFTPENAISCANEYYTFKNANIWKHHDESEPRNTFYNEGQSNSTLNVILNDIPGSVKSFKTINYEGSQSRVVTNFQDNQYYNLEQKPGWFVDSVFTNKESGSLNEFIEKEGKWFNYIKGKEVQHIFDGESDLTRILISGDGSSSFDQASFAIQGLGILGTAPPPCGVLGCTDFTADNYNPSACEDNGSCTYANYGCMAPSASNYDSSANSDDGSCEWYGCTCDVVTYTDGCTNTSLFTDYYSWVNGGGSGTMVDDGSCIAVVNGCTDWEANNWDSTANTDDGTCTYDVEGCTYSSAVNESTGATIDDGTCIWYGCLDSDADNYDMFHADSYGYDPLDSSYGQQHQFSICVFTIILGCTDSSAENYNPAATTDDNSCTYCSQWAEYGTYDVQTYITVTDETFPSANNGTITVGVPNGTLGSDFAGIELLNDIGVLVYTGGPGLPYTFTGLAPGDYYTNVIQDPSSFISSSQSQACNYNTYIMGVGALEITVDSAPAFGCTDSAACNYCAGCTSSTSMCDFLTCAGCTDPYASNYDSSATLDNGTCTYLVDGCTDPTATNYDPTATNDDGSCTYDVYGCMDSRPRNDRALDNSGALEPAATNYDPTATINETDAGNNSNPCTYNKNVSHKGYNLLNSNNFFSSSSTQDTWWKSSIANSKHTVEAVFDVSAAPLIQWPGHSETGYSPTSNDPNGTRFSYTSPEVWMSSNGNINSYRSYGHGNSNFYWHYSNNDGTSWTAGDQWTAGTAVQLVRFTYNQAGNAHSGLVKLDKAYVGYPQLSAADKDPGYDGFWKQKAIFEFLSWTQQANYYTISSTSYTSQSQTIKTGCKFSGYCNTKGQNDYPANGINWPLSASHTCVTGGCADVAACNYNSNWHQSNSCGGTVSCTYENTYWYHGPSNYCTGPQSTGCYTASACGNGFGTCNGTPYNTHTECQNAN